MAIVYKWSFPQFDVIKAEDGLTDVVKTIHWQYAAIDEGTVGPFNAPYSAQEYGTLNLGPPNPSDFIPYNQLTEQWAIDAVSAQIDVPAMQVRLAENVDLQENPPIVPLPPPFN